MTREEIIDYVLSKLDEKSPFDEPLNFIAAANDPSYDKVKPIKVYVEDFLDHVANDCLRTLPLSLLHSDISIYTTSNLVVNSQGVGEVLLSNLSSTDDYLRVIRVYVDYWKRDALAVISSSDPLYPLQLNNNTRGKRYKPIVAVVPEKSMLELYSLPGMENSNTGSSNPRTINSNIYYINCNKTAGSNSANPVLSNIDEFIAIRCAELISNVFKMSELSKIFQKELTEKVNSVLK